MLSLRILMLVLCLGLAVPCIAADLRIESTLTGTYDSNIFRSTGQGKRASAGDGGESVYAASGGFVVDSKHDPLQFSARASVTQSWYTNNKQLTNTGFNVDVLADYERSNGSFTAESMVVRRLANFEDLRQNPQGSLQTLSVLKAQATRSVIGDVRAVIGGGYQRSSNSNSAIVAADYSRFNVNGGFGYYSPAGNVIGIDAGYLRATGLDDRQAIVNDAVLTYRLRYDEQSVALHLLYSSSPVWRIDTRVGYTWHHDGSGVSGTFAGVTGLADIYWSPRDAIQVHLRANRAFETNSAIFANGVKASQILLEATGAMTRNLSITLAASRRHRAFTYDVQAPAFYVGHKEQIDEGRARLNFFPVGRVSFLIEAARGVRRSAVDGFNFNDTTVMATLLLRSRPRDQLRQSY